MKLHSIVFTYLSTINTKFHTIFCVIKDCNQQREERNIFHKLLLGAKEVCFF